jgi:serine/threonine-protein kinase
MPYEQAINAKHVDGRSDIFALGATLYHLVTGKVPFPGGTYLEVAEKKNVGAFTPASALQPEIPIELDDIMEKMLARDPEDRYQTASELIIDLERSHLAAAVLSFADPDLARQDPHVQSYLTSSGEPTRLDASRAAQEPPARTAQDDLWHLRYRGGDGRWRRGRGTTKQILRRLRTGRLPAGMQACREVEGPYRPLDVFPPFRSAMKAHPRPARPQEPGPTQEKAAPPSPSSSSWWRRWWVLGVGGLAIGVLCLVFGIWFFVFGG